MEIARAGDIAIASFTGSCLCEAGEIENASVQLSEYLAAHPPRRLVVDFSGVTSISSRVFSLLLDMRSRLESHQGEVVIVSLSPQLQRVFAIAKLDRAFEFYADRAAAVEKALEPRSDARP